MDSIKVISIVITGLWVLGVVVVGLFWMGQEYALTELTDHDEMRGTEPAGTLSFGSKLIGPLI